MINNNYYFQITGTLTSEHGFEVVNPIIKVKSVPEPAVNTGLIENDYNVYKSLEDYNAGKWFFKLWHNGERVKSFQYPVTSSPFYMFALGLSQEAPTENALTTQIKMLSDVFSIPVENIELVIEQ